MNIETILSLGIFQTKQNHAFYDCDSKRVELSCDSVLDLEIQRVSTESSAYYVLNYSDTIHSMVPVYQSEAFASVLGKASAILDQSNALPVFSASRAS